MEDIEDNGIDDSFQNIQLLLLIIDKTSNYTNTKKTLELAKKIDILILEKSQSITSIFDILSNKYPIDTKKYDMQPLIQPVDDIQPQPLDDIQSTLPPDLEFKVLIYCHSRPYTSNQRQIFNEDFKEISIVPHSYAPVIDDIILKNRKFNNFRMSIDRVQIITLDNNPNESNTADIKEDGFSDEFISSQQSQWDIVCILDCDGEWAYHNGYGLLSMGSSYNPDWIIHTIKKILTIIKPGGKLYLGKIQDDPIISYLRLIVSSLNRQKISAIVKPLIKFGFSSNIIEITKT